MRVHGLTCLAAAALSLSCGSDEGGLESSCEASNCHGAVGQPAGIENAHPGFFLTCVDCHGGDRMAEDKDAAHVPPAPQFVAERGGYVRNLSVSELDAVDPRFLQFINPGDYRVADRACGVASPANDGSGCHDSLIYSAQRSTMATFVGHFNVPRFQAGMQGREGVFGSRDLEDTKFPENPPQGAVEQLIQAVIPAAVAPRDAVETLMDHYLPKNCTHCHQWSYGRNDARGNFRSSGCTACHMLYNDDGVSLSLDPSAVREQPPHPERHQLTVNIGENQCEHCHYQGARIGLLFRGVIEWGFTEEPPLPNIGESLHNHAPEFYLDANSDPRYPADVHWQRGMACADCHVGRDVHGDGRIYSTAKFQTAIRCENCHGNVDEAITEGRATPGLTRIGPEENCAIEDVGGDFFLTCSGDPLKNVFRDAEGKVWLRPVKGGPDLLVRQIKDLLDLGVSRNMTEAMGRDPVTGYSHTEDIECDGCHTAYRQYCFGCHVEMDYSTAKSDLLTGERTVGAEITKRQDYSLDLYFLGTDHRGKIRSFCPSMQVFLSASDVDDTGARFDYFRNRIRTTASGNIGFNWAVDMPHVTSAIPQNCSRCHADQAKGCSTEVAREAYGFGTGRFTFTDDTGKTHDLTQLLTPLGVPLIEFSHEGQGPVAEDLRDSAMSRCVQDHPR